MLIMADLRGHFWLFDGRKIRFLDFFKVVLELFKKCLRIVFGVKRPFLGVFLVLP